MSLEKFGQWAKANLAISTEEEIINSIMERRARGQVEEPDGLYDETPAKKLYVTSPRKRKRRAIRVPA